MKDLSISLNNLQAAYILYCKESNWIIQSTNIRHTHKNVQFEPKRKYPIRKMIVKMLVIMRSP